MKNLFVSFLMLLSFVSNAFSAPSVFGTKVSSDALNVSMEYILYTLPRGIVDPNFETVI
jgi:hypothetical protein